MHLSGNLPRPSLLHVQESQGNLYILVQNMLLQVLLLVMPASSATGLLASFAATQPPLPATSAKFWFLVKGHTKWPISDVMAKCSNTCLARIYFQSHYICPAHPCLSGSQGAITSFSLLLWLPIFPCSSCRGILLSSCLPTSGRQPPP
jgi:hypothetical protein